MNFTKNSSEILEEVLSELPSSYDKRKGQWIWDICKSFSIVLSRIYTYLTNVSSSLDVDNLTGAELERFILQRTGIERKKATYSTGVITVTGNGTIPKNATFETEGLIRFESIEEVTIVGSGKVKIQAVNSGTIGNVIANSIVKIPITIQGIVSCSNEAETTGGYEEETDTDLITRYYERLRTPATSGNIYHYKQWAKEVSGVGDAKIFPLWNGNNTVKVVIINNDRKPASDTLVKEVQDYIDPNITGTGQGVAPIGAFCTVESAKGKEVNISVDLTTDSSVSEEIIKLGIQKELENYFSSIAFNSNLLSYAIVGARILNVDGVLDYSNLLINDNPSNMECLEDEVFILGSVVIS